MKLYIKRNQDQWLDPEFRSDLENVPKEQYNSEGIYDLEPTPGPTVDLNTISSYEIYLDDNNIARYRWTTTLKTGESLRLAIQDKWVEIRTLRDRLLAQTDYTQLQDYIISSEKKQAWADYRQQLRDVTTQEDPFQLIWPTDPNGLVNFLKVTYV
jgi:hypothetical protein